MDLMDLLTSQINETIEIIRVKLDASNLNSNIPEIEDFFKRFKELLEELEISDTNDQYYSSFKHAYHNTMSQFLASIGEQIKANRHETLAKKFKIKNQLDEGEPRSSVETKKEEEPENSEINEILKEIKDQDNINEKYFQDLCNFVGELLKTVAQDFAQYLQLNASKKDFDEQIANNQLDNYRGEGLGPLNKELERLLIVLQICINEKIYEKKKEFIKEVLISSNPEKLLFVNLNEFPTKEDIKKEFRKLYLNFHPDLARWLREEDKSLAHDIFILMRNKEHELLEILEQKISSLDGDRGEMNYYLNKGNEFWQEALRKINSENANGLDLLIDNAYKQYRAACKIADRHDDDDFVREQIHLRGQIARCLFSTKKHKNHLGAQLFALSSLKLIFKHSHRIQLSELLNVQKIFDEVNSQRKEEPKESEKQNSLIKGSNLNVLVSSRFSSDDKQRQQKLIDEKLNETCSKMLIKCDSSLICYQAAASEILHTKEKAKKLEEIGTQIKSSGNYLFNFSKNPWVTLGSCLVASLAFVGGYLLIRKGGEIMNEPKKRERLNIILGNALDSYLKGEYRLFFHRLSEPYSDQGDTIFKLEKPTDDIKYDKLIDSLLSHGFRPDGIAYLLNLIGEVLISGCVIPDGFTTRQLKEKGEKALMASLNAKLAEAANKLDERITEFRVKHMGQIYDSYKKLKEKVYSYTDLLKNQDFLSIAHEHIDDSLSIPFKSRLDEVQNMSKLNLAIFHVLNDGEEGYDICKRYIEEVRDSVENSFRFPSVGAINCEALEDLLWALTGLGLDDPRILEPNSKNDSSCGILTYKKDEEIRLLYEELEKTNSKNEKIEKLIQIANHYMERAKKDEKENRIKGLCNWVDAKEVFRKARELDDANPESALGFARCLMSLTKYEQVYSFLKKNDKFINHSDYWIISSLASLRQNQYTDSLACINEARKKDPNNKEAQNIHLLLSKLKETSSVLNDQDQKEIKSIVNMNTRYNGENRQVSHYKILSIDGGGVRGLIPAVWLAEIEKEAKQPISHMFDMIAGTSVGAIIGAGLSMPLKEVDYYYEDNVFIPPVFSDYKPHYSASELVDIFRNKPNKIFESNTKVFGFQLPGYLNPFPLTNTKYRNEGRLGLFDEYFGGYFLKDALTELVIPTYNEDNPLTNYLFTRSSSRHDPSKNESIRNVLMATSAAPTFFPSYKINGKGVFLDGGINLNNPSSVAKTEALQFASQENLFVLSLGTGAFIPDPLNPNLYRGQLFWAKNFPQVAMTPQEGNVDVEMHASLKENYQRWQIWLEKPIALDDCLDSTLDSLIEMARVYLEEARMADDNRFNKLIEFFSNDNS